MTRLKWEKHGDVWRLVDDSGYTWVYLGYQVSTYHAVYFSGSGTWKEIYSFNKKRLMAEVKRRVMEALAS